MISRENQTFNLLCISRDHSSTIPSRQSQLIHPNTFELINIIQNEFTKPTHHSSVSTNDVFIQCSPNEFDSPVDQSSIRLIGRVSAASWSNDSIVVSVRPGYKECGIQVDFRDHQIDLLLQIYSDRLPAETIEYFYEISHSDFQSTCSQIDEYLQTHPQEELVSSTIHPSNTSADPPNFDEEFSAELPRQISISSSTLTSLEEIYGQLPDKSSLTSTNNEILLPFDEDLSRGIYQAVRRYLTRSNETIKPVNKNQKWKSPMGNSSGTSDHVPSMREIIDEEQRAVQSQKSKQVILLKFLI